MLNSLCNGKKQREIVAQLSSIHLQDKAQNTKTKEKLQFAIQIEYLARQKFFLKTSPAIPS
jgi:hypothetical protein